MGDFNEIFLGNQKNFRGCLENVYFNNIEVMTRAEEEESEGGEAKVYNVQWECSPEFDQSAAEPGRKVGLSSDEMACEKISSCAHYPVHLPFGCSVLRELVLSKQAHTEKNKTNSTWRSNGR